MLDQRIGIRNQLGTMRRDFSTIISIAFSAGAPIHQAFPLTSLIARIKSMMRTIR